MAEGNEGRAGMELPCASSNLHSGTMVESLNFGLGDSKSGKRVVYFGIVLWLECGRRPNFFMKYYPSGICQDYRQ